jgi:hypothetical protein
MANFDASTPQLKAVKHWIDALTVVDMSKVEPVVSRNFKFQTFPKDIDLPEQTKEEYLQWFGRIFVSMTKMDVSIQRRRNAFKLAD